MLQTTAAVIEAVRRYVRALEEQGIHVNDVILFGPFARGTAKEKSDRNVALISESFSFGRFDDRRRFVLCRRSSDSRIEPMPFRPERFAEGGNLVDEIKKDGIRIEL
jgi:predicted nucleotidyltransferase